MNPKLTDKALGDLPISAGRAELLEEIMSTPVLDDRPVRTESSRSRRGWLVPAAAAAAVVLLAGGVAWSVQGADPAPDGSGNVAGAPSALAGDWTVLDAPGWVVTAASLDSDSGELSYEKDGQLFEITWYPADSYDDYVEDRRRLTDPPSDGEPVEVLGASGLLWADIDESAPGGGETPSAPSGDAALQGGDHTAIREVQDGRWFEFHGTGMDRAAYLTLLDRLRAVDHAGFEAAMPEGFVDESERPAAIQEMTDGIGQYVDPLLPAGAATTITSDQVDPYHLGADVAGAVACAWMDVFAAATQDGDQATAQRASDALATSRQWPVLQQMDDRGDYPDVVWEYADEVADGNVPEDYQDGLGCSTR